jgi:hypothetical protein
VLRLDHNVEHRVAAGGGGHHSDAPLGHLKALRGRSNIDCARSKISVTPTRTAPGPRLNNNRVGSLSSAELGVLLVTLKVTIDEILPKERASTDFSGIVSI